MFAEAFDICGSAGTDSKVVCHFKGLIFSKFLTKPELKALSWISWGICWGSNYIILQNSTEKVAAEPRRTCQAKRGDGGERCCGRGEGWGCSWCRLSGAGRHPWRPQPARDAEAWARHKPHGSLTGRVSAEDVFTQQSEKTWSRGRYKPRKVHLWDATAVLWLASPLNAD